MNQYADTENSGLLKDSYGQEDSALADALKKKRLKLAETKLGLITEETENTNGAD